MNDFPNALRPIETKYRGYRFRSRLEARWAVYFDAIGLKWEYEPQGFNLDGMRYLPDFWLPQVTTWAEIKPVKFTDKEEEKAKRLAEETDTFVLMLIGTPDLVCYRAAKSAWW